MKQKQSRRLAAAIVATLVAVLATACVDEESSLGMGLVDNNMIYSGQTATLTAGRALSVRDDSLLTTNYTYIVLGNHSDPRLGRVGSTLYTQIALPASSPSINLTELVVDSVVLVLHKDKLYPDTNATYSFHFEVMQLDEPVRSDSLYYSCDTLRVNPQHRYFDSDVQVGPTDTLVRLRMDNSIADILTHMATAEEFLDITKGLRIRITDQGDDGMLSVALAASDSRLSVYYRTNATDLAGSEYQFPLGTGACHFTHFEHDYSTAVTAGADSVDGSQVLYLEPLGGYNMLLDFSASVQTFLAAHPYATVHHAELLLPVAAGADAMRPERILALSKVNDSTTSYIDDLIDPYTMAGFDGKYDDSRQCYRLRVTQHVQDMLRRGGDGGTLLVPNARRYEAARTLICGPSAATPLKIEIVFSE